MSSSLRDTARGSEGESEISVSVKGLAKSLEVPAERLFDMPLDQFYLMCDEFRAAGRKGFKPFLEKWQARLGVYKKFGSEQ